MENTNNNFPHNTPHLTNNSEQLTPFTQSVVANVENLINTLYQIALQHTSTHPDHLSELFGIASSNARELLLNHLYQNHIINYTYNDHI